MLVAENEAKNLIKKLPDKSTFEDIRYRLFYIAEKLKNARQQIKDKKIHSQTKAEKGLKNGL